MSYESGGLLRVCDMIHQGIVQINRHVVRTETINLTWPTRASTEPIGAVQMRAAPAAMMRWNFIISDWIWLTLLSRLVNTTNTVVCMFYAYFYGKRLLR